MLGFFFSSLAFIWQKFAIYNYFSPLPPHKLYGALALRASRWRNEKQKRLRGTAHIYTLPHSLMLLRCLCWWKFSRLGYICEKFLHTSGVSRMTMRSNARNWEWHTHTRARIFLFEKLWKCRYIYIGYCALHTLARHTRLDLAYCGAHMHTHADEGQKSFVTKYANRYLLFIITRPSRALKQANVCVLYAGGVR